MKVFGEKWKLDLCKRYKRWFILWGICLILFGTVTILSWLSRNHLYDQQAARRWSQEEDYAQLSCFYPITDRPTDYEFQSLHHSIEEALKAASMETENENAKLFVDAYSVTGSITLSTEHADMKVKAVGVSEQFFQFHPVSLLSGSYFDENMLMKDGIILDEEAAFTLYGSNDIVGMPVYIGSVRYYIRGVVSHGNSYLQKKAGLDSSVCYVPIETMETLGTSEGSYTYEVLMPNPVDGFAKDIVVTVLNDTEGRLEIIENSSRFSTDARKELLLDYPLRSMSSKGILYPYWENVARAVEDIVAVLYAVQVVTFLIVGILTLWYLWYRWKNRTWNLKMLWERGQDIMDKRRTKTLGVLLFCLILGLTGCGKSKKEADSSAVEQSKEFVYSFTSLDEKLDEIDFSQAIYANERLIIASYRYEEIPNESGMVMELPEAREISEEDVLEDISEEAVAEEAVAEDAVVEEAIAEEEPIVEAVMDDFYIEEEVEGYISNMYFKITQSDLEGNVCSEFEILVPSEGGINTFTADESGNVYLVLCEYGTDTSNPEYIRDSYTLVGYSQTGEELFRTALGTDIGPEEWYYTNQMICNEEAILLSSSDGLEIYHKDGSLSKKIETEDALNGTMYLMRDGNPGFVVYGDSGMYLRTLDIETEEFSERNTFPFSAYEYSYFSGISSDLLLTNGTGVYSYNIGDEGLQKIMDFVDSDLLCNNLYSLIEIKENKYFGSYYDGELDKTCFGFFDKVDPSTIKEKSILTLGCCWLEDELRRRVVEYNKTNEAYRIRIEDYSQYNTQDDYSAGLTKMNTDIVSGNTPDIIVLNTEMPVESFISKGVLTDLLPFLENDSELKKEDYSEHIIDVYSQDGKWYQMVPSYTLYTLFGKTSEVGKEPGWTLEQLQALRREMGDDMVVFSEMTQSSLLHYCLLFAQDQFINWETGECSFDSEEFIELLEFINEFPKEIDYEELYNDPDYWEQQESIFREGKALLLPYTLANFEDFLYCEKGTFGEEITAIGFPVSEGVGSVIMSNANYGISAKSKHQKEAWEFLRYYLTAEYQDTISYGWPILKSSLETRMKEAQEAPYYTDENGEKVEYQYSYYVNGVEVFFDPLTQEDCDRVLGFIESTNQTYSYNQAIINIVTEETASYFEGEKTPQEVADIIQSRIHIYVNENR